MYSMSDIRAQFVLYYLVGLHVRFSYVFGLF
jgi:hypothetical protein